MNLRFPTFMLIRLISTIKPVMRSLGGDSPQETDICVPKEPVESTARYF